MLTKHAEEYKVNDPHVEKAKKVFSLWTEDVAQIKCSCICPVGINWWWAMSCDVSETLVFHHLRLMWLVLCLHATFLRKALVSPSLRCMGSGAQGPVPLWTACVTVFQPSEIMLAVAGPSLRRFLEFSHMFYYVHGHVRWMAYKKFTISVRWGVLSYSI
jgi:hypothetical protein